LLCISCKNKAPNPIIEQAQLEKVEVLQVPSSMVDVSKLYYSRTKAQYEINGLLYSGYATIRFENGDLKEKWGVLNGKRQNESLVYCEDGHLRERAYYHQDKLHGEKKIWTTDSTHVLVSQASYHLGKLHGKHQIWYKTGEPYKLMNYNLGKEEGMQKSFKKNGDLYAHYEIKNGEKNNYILKEDTSSTSPDSLLPN